MKNQWQVMIYEIQRKKIRTHLTRNQCKNVGQQKKMNLRAKLVAKEKKEKQKQNAWKSVRLFLDQITFQSDIS